MVSTHSRPWGHRWITQSSLFLSRGGVLTTWITYLKWKWLKPSYGYVNSPLGAEGRLGDAILGDTTNILILLRLIKTWGKCSSLLWKHLFKTGLIWQLYKTLFMHHSRSALSHLLVPFSQPLAISYASQPDQLPPLISSHCSCDCKTIAAIASFSNSWICFRPPLWMSTGPQHVLHWAHEKCSSLHAIFWPNKTHRALASQVTCPRDQTILLRSIWLLIPQWKDVDQWQMETERSQWTFTLTFFFWQSSKTQGSLCLPCS